MPYEEELPMDDNFGTPPSELNDLAHSVIGAAIEVHRQLGPGMPEAAYQNALVHELGLRHIPCEREKPIQIIYKGIVVACGRIDLLVGSALIVEVKAVASVIPLHRLQTLGYMRLIHQPLALLINFEVPILKSGIHRIIDSNIN
jgi:GxxExxY protein